LVVTNNANGCKDTADIPVLVDHTNVKNIAKQHFNAYPNPVGSGDILDLQGLMDAQVVWVDPAGRTVAESKVVDGKTTVPAGISQGLYYLTVKSREQYAPVTLWVH
jgi:hypothetical protein